MEMKELKDIKISPDPYYEYSDELRLSGLPIVFDNGAWSCRVGWASCDKPNLVFKNLIAKPRKERGKKDGETQVGNDISNIEAVRFQLKTQFDKNVVTHYEIQEQIFDYVFSHLSINTEGCVNHPIVLTEPFLNPNYSRSLMSELLFECYQVPHVCYGIDSLFSYQYNGWEGQSSVIISCGYQCTHVIPVINGCIDASKAKRIDLGGFSVSHHLHKLLQLKYPAHMNTITPSRSEEILWDYGFIAMDYREHLKKWLDGEFYDANVVKLQLPYSVAAPTLTTEQQKDRRKELAKKLVEMNAKKREERLVEDERHLSELLELREIVELTPSDHSHGREAFKSMGINNIAALNKSINQLQAKIEKTRVKILAYNNGEDVVEEPKPKVAKEITVPESVEEKKAWLSELRKKRSFIVDRKHARKQRRQDLAKRRTAAAQERMRLISELARKEKRDDDFGMRDEDWDVYKVINKDAGDTDSEEEQEKLIELEEVLRQHDPEFVPLNQEQELSPKEANQLHIGVERMAGPECLFQPAMLGSVQAGISETLNFVLNSYPSHIAQSLASNIFVTGSLCQMPGFVERLNKDLLENRPFQSHFSVSLAENPELDAWSGARQFALAENFLDFAISQADYQEKGGEFFRVHPCSNKFEPYPLVISLDEPIVNTSGTEGEDTVILM
uniref:Actin-related protein 5 n=1 Tax=Cacopsylla melanoneura TaxID=428564 RepID=A0A8D8THR6_9HEMI